MHAYLVTGGGEEERALWAEDFFKTQGVTEVIRIGHPKKNHLIRMVRELIHNLLFSPISPKLGRGVLIEDAHLLTTEAANAFLKTLEEPLGNTTLILTAPSRESVLTTIASRALHINLGAAASKITDENKEEAEAIFVKLIKSGVGEKFKFIEKINKREEAVNFCVGQIFASREILRRKVNGKMQTGNSLSTPQLAAVLARLEQTRQDLEANVNVKLALTELLLHYP